MFKFVYWLLLAYFLVLIPRYLRYRNRAYFILIGWGALASIYEMGTGILWLSKEAIRIDIFLIVIVTGLMYLVNCLGYLQLATLSESEQARVLRRHAWLLTPPVILVAGLLCFTLFETQQTDKRISSSKNNYLEACNKNTSTQRRCFGDFTNTEGGQLVGHFENKDSNASYRELWINQAGEYTLLLSGDSLSYGELLQQSATTYQLTATTTNLGDAQLSQTAPDQLVLHMRFPGHLMKSEWQRAATISAKTEQPVAESKVNFVGVFSVLEPPLKDQSFWLTQVWIWHDQTKIWGYFLRDNFSFGKRADFLTVHEWQQECRAACRSETIHLRVPRGNFELQKQSAGWQLKAESDTAALQLRPGQYIPVLMLDQAPLLSRELNQQWLRDLNSLYHSRWKIPPREQLQAF